MSWKHDKLSNSEVMKEFEKVAYDKGMIKDNSIANAAKRIKGDIKSDNLISNLFGFANRLKQEGFDKYAMELEKKIMAYQVSKIAGEKDGEKLLEFAHPEGSPNVGDGEDGNVENLIDQHKKMVEVARKSPMSKKNAKVLADVMVALGQEADINVEDEVNKSNFYKKISFNKLDKLLCIKKLDDAKKLWNIIDDQSGLEKVVINHLDKMIKLFSNINQQNISMDSLRNISFSSQEAYTAISQTYSRI